MGRRLRVPRAGRPAEWDLRRVAACRRRRGSHPVHRSAATRDVALQDRGPDVQPHVSRVRELHGPGPLRVEGGRQRALERRRAAREPAALPRRLPVHRRERAVRHVRLSRRRERCRLHQLPAPGPQHAPEIPLSHLERAAALPGRPLPRRLARSPGHRGRLHHRPRSPGRGCGSASAVLGRGLVIASRVLVVADARRPRDVPRRGRPIHVPRRQLAVRGDVVGAGQAAQGRGAPMGRAVAVRGAARGALPLHHRRAWRDLEEPRPGAEHDRRRRHERGRVRHRGAVPAPARLVRPARALHLRGRSRAT